MSRNAINVGFIDIGTVVELLVGLPVDKITVTPGILSRFFIQVSNFKNE